MGIDSIATLEIIMALEDEFGFEVDDDDLNAELVASIASMTDYVAARSRDTGELM